MSSSPLCVGNRDAQQSAHLYFCIRYTRLDQENGFMTVYVVLPVFVGSRGPDGILFLLPDGIANILCCCYILRFPGGTIHCCICPSCWGWQRCSAPQTLRLWGMWVHAENKNKNKECALSGLYKPERCETWKAARKWKICRFHKEVLMVHSLQQGSPAAAAACTAHTTQSSTSVCLYYIMPLNNTGSVQDYIRSNLCIKTAF